MWVTDRSRYLTGLQHCNMHRYYQYHAFSTGIVPRKVSMPLASGTRVHVVLANILKHVQEYKETPPRAAVRGWITQETDAYRAEVAAEGFINVDSEEIANTVMEQTYLVAGLCWAWYRVQLPYLMNRFEVLAVEQEELMMFGKAHILMGTPDIVLRRKEDNTIGVHDFKTVASMDQNWVDSWNSSVQMSVGTKMVESRLQVPVEHFYIHPLVKGTRKSEYNQVEGAYTGPRRQDSFFCYVYAAQKNPPLIGPDIQPKWNYLDGAGKRRTLGKAYSKMPLWTIEFGNKPPEVSPVEFWVMDQLSPNFLTPLLGIIGPYSRQNVLVDAFMREMAVVEEHYEDSVKLIENESWGSERHDQIASMLFPRSWDCDQFYGSKCPFITICYKQPGWKTPLETGQYMRRTPHHKYETDTCVKGVA